jgi:cytochrome P450 family 710 subfamily A protein
VLLLLLQVVKEVLRFRPPAPMVPQVAMQPFKLTGSYTAPKGAFIIPDIISACRQGYTDGDKFDPERFRCGCFSTYAWLCVGGVEW